MENIIGLRYGKLVVLEECRITRPEYKYSKRGLRCLCDCGKVYIGLLYSIRSGLTSSCGCGYRLDLVGKKYGRLSVIEEVKTDKKKTVFKCLCDCGNERIVIGTDLSRGRVSCCGCDNGDSRRKIKYLNRRLYEVWKGMKARCRDSKHVSYKNYGGKGIYVCKEWSESFKSFYDWAMNNGWEPNLTIDRIENSDPYSPETCKWVTKKENSRKTTRVKLSMEKAAEIRNSNLSSSDLSKVYNVNITTIRQVKQGRIWNS